MGRRGCRARVKGKMCSRLKEQQMQKKKKTKEDTWRPDNKESNHCAFLLGWLTSSPFHKSALLRSKHFLSGAVDRIMPSVTAAHFAFIPESRSCRHWSLRALELVLCNKLSHHMRSLCRATREQPLLATTRGRPTQHHRPAQPIDK